MKNFKYILILFFSIAISSCGPSDGGSGGTSTGNPLVNLKLASYNSTLNLSSLTFCFKRLRFKLSDIDAPSGTDENIDLELGEVSISPSGTDLGFVSVPPGTYERIEFDLDSDCLSAQTVQLTNSNGSFQTDDNIKIKFNGTFVVDQSNHVLDLFVQNITSALNTVTNNSEISTKAESVSGTY